MKPDNIILMNSSSADPGSSILRRYRGKVPKIIDFGMAKGRRVAETGKALATAAMMTVADMVAGSPEYMAPEQWAGVEAAM
jgi:serine/threonine protein kinase|eukprot:COSAG01_NODE_33020_length_571_cov_1.290254_1_plen_81_part_00